MSHLDRENRYIKNSSLTKGMTSCVVVMGKRDRLEIIAAILDLCSKPRSKTRIMYGTNLSWKMLQQYLGHMQSLKLLEVKEDSTKYVTTARGQNFLEKWKELQELM